MRWLRRWAGVAALVVLVLTWGFNYAMYLYTPEDELAELSAADFDGEEDDEEFGQERFLDLYRHEYDI